MNGNRWKNYDLVTARNLRKRMIRYLTLLVAAVSLQLFSQHPLLLHSSTPPIMPKP